MSDSSILQPAGPTGPLLRAAVKTQFSKPVKQPYVVPDAPWRVDQAFKYAGLSRGGGITDSSTFAFLLGWPSSQVGTALVIRHLAFGIMSDGTAGATDVFAVWRRATAPSGGTIPSNFILKSRTADGPSLDDIRETCLATKGGLHTAYPFQALVANQYAPTLFPVWLSRKSSWQDAILLAPGEYFGFHYDYLSAVAPNGHERFYLRMEWEEVTL
jgi:hypothetical protein